MAKVSGGSGAFVTMTIHGLPEVQAALKRLGEIARADVLEDAATVGAEVIRSEAARLVSVRTGNLRASLITETIGRSSASVKVGVGPSKAAPYGIFLEWGTLRMRARPYLRPAFDTKKNTAAHRVREALKRIVLETVK